MNSNRPRARFGAAIVAAVLLLPACAESTPEVTPSPSNPDEPSESVSAAAAAESADGEPTDAEEDGGVVGEGDEEAREVTTGTRDAPLALGETRKISDGSAWIVGITGSNLDAADEVLDADPYQEGPSDGERFVVATLSVTVDAEALETQGFDIGDGVDPFMSVYLEFVGSDGRGYDEAGAVCFTDDPLSSAGAIYEDEVTVTGDICLTVPEGAVDGGLWRISNTENDAVWVEAS